MAWLLLKNAVKLTLPTIEAKIHILEENKIYFPGDIIKGNLTISHSEKFSLHGLIVSFEGFVNIEFKKRNQTYCESRIFGSQNLYVYGEINQAIRLMLQPGSHNFPFVIQISKYIPISYKDNYASISYALTATLLCGLAKLKLAQKNINIKLKDSIFQSISEENSILSISRSENLFFNKSSSLKFNFRILKLIFCPDEKIFFSFELLNNEKTCSLFIEVLQKFCYKIPLEDSKKTSRVVTSYEKEISGNFIDFLKLTNSEILYPSQFGSEIFTIDLEYSIKVELKQNSKILRGEIPLYIDVKKDSFENNNDDQIMMDEFQNLLSQDRLKSKSENSSFPPILFQKTNFSEMSESLFSPSSPISPSIKDAVS